MDNIATTKKENLARPEQSSNAEIIPVDNQIVKFDPELQVEQAKIAAKALMSVISQKNKKVEFNGEQYLEFEDWQTIAQFYNHTVGIEWTKPIEEAGKIIGFEAKAVLYNRDGIVVGGAEAACMKDEPNWAKKPMFQLRSMSQTRAMAKALRSRFGFVAVLAGFKPTPAEEMDGVAMQNTPTQPAKLGSPKHTGFYCSVHDNTIVLRPAGVSKQGTPYKAFYSCTQKDNGSFCKGPFLDSEGEIVRQNPETGEMEVQKVQEETSIDKARRILDAKVPKGEYPL